MSIDMDFKIALFLCAIAFISIAFNGPIVDGV